MISTARRYFAEVAVLQRDSDSAGNRLSVPSPISPFVSSILSGFEEGSAGESQLCRVHRAIPHQSAPTPPPPPPPPFTPS